MINITSIFELLEELSIQTKVGAYSSNNSLFPQAVTKSHLDQPASPLHDLEAQNRQIGQSQTKELPHFNLTILNHACQNPNLSPHAKAKSPGHHPT